MQFSFTIPFLSPKEKHFKIINSFIIGEIILTEGFNISLQHAFFDRGKSSYKNIILIRILLNVSDNRLVYYTSSLSIRNKAILRRYYINSLVYYGEREINLLIIITSVSITIHTNTSETFIHYNHFIIHGSYHLLHEISILQSFASFENNNINKLHTLVTNLYRIDTNKKFISTLNNDNRKWGKIDRKFFTYPTQEKYFYYQFNYNGNGMKVGDWNW